MYKELLYDNNVSKVRGVQFGIMSPQDILQRSVVEITRTDTYTGNEPCDNGLFDVRMGTMELGKTCATCEQTNVFCPGHFGHIVLAKPVFYVKFISVVIDILRCVCFRCSKLLVDVDSPEVKALQVKRCARQKRWDTMTKLCQKVKTCPCCKERQPDRVVKDNENTLIKMEWRDSDNNVSADVVLSAEEVLRVFKRITEEDGETLGFSVNFNRPEWLICTVLPVPPPSVRPSVRNDTGHRSEDDLTHILSDIVKFNNVLRGKIEKGANFDTVMYNTMMLQYHVATLVDNSTPTMYITSKDRTGRTLRTLVDRLKSKEGRIRGNLMGKRVDFSARTVITPDPNLSIDELGVPMQIAMNLTFPEIVNADNLEDMRRLVKNGPDRYPGAKHVRKAQQGMRTVRLKGNNRPGLEDLVEVGDVVERHMRNGDYVLFNRQPSLHKMSMMAHRVRVMPYKTFRLNVCVCSSYNADFDGDEMNMHLPQSYQTHEEIRHLAAVALHVISPRHGKPIITIVQDVTLGVHRMTQSMARVTRRQFMNLTCSNPTFSGVLPPPPAIVSKDSEILTGKELLSTVIPRNTNVYMGGVHIKDGVIEASSNALNSKTYSAPSVGLVHSIYVDHGVDAFTTFMNNTQKLVCDWLVLTGFSVGVSDLVLSPEVRTKIKNIMTSMKDKVYEKIQDVHNNRFENLGTRSNAEFFESEINNIMNTGQKEAETAAIDSFKGMDNRMLNMIHAGSKGKTVNFSQMVSSVGQQIVDDKRIVDGYDNRTLPHFTKFDDGPGSRGFVENSFIDGLTPHEFFFHAMGGRIGLIDTAVRSVTWDTAVFISSNGGHSKRVRIGEWIDSLMNSSSGDVKKYPQESNMEILALDHDVVIPTLDDAGKTSWGKITAVTRHDPSDKMYKVRTSGGREVIVADSESLLVWNGDTHTFDKTQSRDVIVGHFLPVTMTFPQRSNEFTKSHVDMSEYLSKTDHIYGTDFHMAAERVKSTMDGRIHIPPGSNVNNLKVGCVYPYHATRCHGHMPDKFELNFANGVFIGIYLADGHTCEKSGVVGITKNDPTVRNWVDGWFKSNGFTTITNDNSDYTPGRNVRGTSMTIVGHSTLLARFLDRFVGHGSHDKHVPNEAFTSPDDFVKGLLSGYFSGDGTVGENDISSGSVSDRLTEGIAVLCSRFGAFAKMFTTRVENHLRTEIRPIYRLSLRAQWARIMADELQLIHPAKAAALDNIKCSDVHRNYAFHNDMVLDPVVSIEEIDGGAYPKLYDVTVPSTLNFVLANGLGVRDTSETGYIQRKLVKSMEDCKVLHDYTVRNAAGQIVQFLYGEDGADSAKLEYHYIPYLEMDDDTAFMDAYLLVHTNELRPYVREEVLEGINEDAFHDAMANYYERVQQDRRFVQSMVHRKRESKQIVFPINVKRIIQNTAQVMDTYGASVHLSDLDPMYILEQIDALENDLTVGVVTRKTRVPLLGVLLRCFMCPKQLLTKHRLNRVAFDRVVQVVRASFYSSLVNPGEVVGITAAQSIGEPTTQLSCLFSSRIHAISSDSRTNDASKMYCGPIGNFIDDILAAHPDRVVDLGGDSVVLDLTPECGMDYRIVGVSDQEKTSWKPISQVSRHPANGGMVRVHTKSGKKTCATLSHSFLKRTTDGIVPVKGHDLKIGDRMPVAQHIPSVPDPLKVIEIGGVPYELTRDLGWLIGAYLADGHIGNNTLHISKVLPEYQEKLRTILKDIFGKDMQQRAQQGGNVLQGWDMSLYRGMNNYVHHSELVRFLDQNFNGGSFRKRVAPFVYASNLEFIRGVIGGYFDGDGNVGTCYAKSTIRSASVSEELTEDFILLLAHIGIFACKCREKHIKEQGRNDLFTIQVLRKFAPKFRDEIGFVVLSKAQALDSLVDYVQREDAHSVREETDMIPELGDTLAFVGKTLKLEGQSRLYGRYTKKDAIGRETLRKAVNTFDQEAFMMAVEADEARDDNARKLRNLQKLCDSAVPDAKGRIPLTEEAARDLADVGESVKEKGKKPGGEHVRAARDTRIHTGVLQRLIDRMTLMNETKRQSVIDAVDAVEPHMVVLRQALDADVVWDEIVELEYLDDPGEMVYDFTVPGNDSFMVDCGVLVHNTLNSVHYDEELLLSVNGKLKRVKIGDFTHDVMNRAAPDAIEHHPQDAEFAWVRNEDVKVLAVDDVGRVDWQTVEAVTHHPVINEDGSDTLLHVRTRTGREVRATRGESFLKREDNKIVRLKGSDLRVGDRLPVSTVLPTRDVAAVDSLRVEDYLHPSEWLYVSHVEAALRVRENERIGWFKNLSSHGVHVPYSRGDALLEAFVGTEKKAPKRKHSTRPGCVYPAHTSIKKDEDMQHIPEHIPLDADFGFMVGAYLADGCIAIGNNKKDAAKRPYAVLICNMSKEFRARFESFCQRYNIGYHIDAGTRLMQSGNRSPTVSLRLHSLLMGELFMRLFGQGAEVKRIDPVLLGAPDEFLHALLDGYWSGDGHVSDKNKAMSAYSASKGMLQDIQQIMVRFGIPTRMVQMSEECHQYNLEKHRTTVRGWTLWVPACGCERFRDIIDLSLKRKRQRLDDMGDIDNTHAVYDRVPNVKLSTGETTLSRSRIPFMLAGTKHDGDREVLQRIVDENIFYDEVVEIRKVPNGPEQTRVYDLTVTNAHTFALLNGLYSPNTFHLAGSASSASGTITQGVPRLRELLNVSKNIKTPAMVVSVKKEFATDKDKCADIMNSIQTARFRDVVKSSRIYYDPSDDPDRSLIDEDRDLLRLHARYADFIGSCEKRKSPWLLRFEFDHAEMLKLNVMFTDIDFALRDHYDEELSCIFSDDNSSSLVCRMRLNVSDNMDRNDILTEVMALEQSILENVVIKGVKDIEKAILERPKEINKVYDDVTGKFVNRQEWKIITAGSNMIDVMANPYLDYTKTYTNDVVEVLRVLGIEAARTALYDEIRNVMWMTDEENVNYRHMALLVDTITNRGHLVSIDRHGINKGDIGPLAKCSFEETDKMLIKAGIFCEMDKINGVSANIMLGQVPPCGTGDGDMIMDIESILQNVEPGEVDARYHDISSNEKMRRQEEEEAIAAAATGTSGATGTTTFRLPNRDASLIEKKGDDIILI